MTRRTRNGLVEAASASESPACEDVGSLLEDDERNGGSLPSTDVAEVNVDAMEKAADNALLLTKLIRPGLSADRHKGQRNARNCDSMVTDRKKRVKTQQRKTWLVDTSLAENSSRWL